MVMFCMKLIIYSSDIILFFFKQKTAYEMRISDWSSDVCSSDLIESAQVGDVFAKRQTAIDLHAGRRLIGAELGDQLAGTGLELVLVRRRPPFLEIAGRPEARALVVVAMRHLVADHRTDRAKIGRASWRERVCPYV